MQSAGRAVPAEGQRGVERGARGEHDGTIPGVGHEP